MAVVFDALADLAFLAIPGMPYPEHRAAKARGNQAMVAQFPGARRNRLQRLLFGDSAEAGANQQHGSTRMRDYTTYLNAVTIPNVWKALTQIGNTFASTELRWLDADDEEVDIKVEYPDLWQLIQHPNDETDYPLFCLQLVLDDQLTGNALIALDELNGLGQPLSMYRLRPDKTAIKRAPDGSLWYIYTTGAPGMEEIAIYGKAEGEIEHVKWPHPTNPLWGMGPVEAGEVSLSADRRIQEFRYSYFDRGGILEGVLTTDGDLSDDEYDRLITRWRALRSGGRMTMKTAILTQGATYTPIQEPLGNVPIVDLSKMSRNDVLEIFGVPPPMTGDFSGTNYRNAQEARAFYYGDTLGPIHTRFEGFWTNLGRRWDDGLHAAYDRREIIDYLMRAQAASLLAGTASFTRNKILVAAGFDPYPDGDPIGEVIVSTSRAVELFPTDYEEPNDLLPLTAEPTDLPGRIPFRRLTPAQTAAQQRDDAEQTDAGSSAPKPGAKGSPVRASHPSPIPLGLVSPAYRAAVRKERRRANTQRRLAARARPPADAHQTIVTEVPAEPAE